MSYPPEVTYGGLMHALVYHTGLNIEIKNSFLFFEDSAPFKRTDIRGVLASHKRYNLECLKVKKYSMQYYKYKNDP